MSDPYSPTFAEAEFRKAARSRPNGDCVLVARRNGWVAVRDDKTAFGADDDRRLLLTAAAFDTAQDRWRVGAFAGGPVELVEYTGGVVMRLAERVGPELRFTRAEIDAFLDGVARHEFDTATASAPSRTAGSPT